MRVLRQAGVIAAPRERVFSLLEDARTAGKVNPAFLAVAVVRAPWIPKPAERTLLQVRHRGVVFDLETEIAEYRRGHFLLERQVAGPFASWEHAVNVEDDGPGARLTEVLAYELPLGPLGRAFDCLVLHRDLEQTLRTRLARLRELLEHD